MTFQFPRLAGETIAPAVVLISAMRCWRDARDRGSLVQPCLFRTLAEADGELLAPVLDGLIHSYETALGRAIVTGDGWPSEDEQLLLNLVDGLRSCASIGASQGCESVLACALCSTRIMLAATLRAPQALQ
jgi:hypothetical protein